MITLKMIKIRNKNRLLKSYTLKISERKLLRLSKINEIFTKICYYQSIKKILKK